jgi:hypothetical protein
MGMFCRWHLAAAVLVMGVASSAAAAPAATARPGATPTRPATPVERTLVNPNSTLVFPFEKAPADKNPPSMLGEWIAGQLRAGLDASGKYTAVLYYPNSPLVQRARNQGAITPDDIQRVIDPQRGVIDQGIAMRVASGVGTAKSILGSVEDYTYTPAENKVDVTATVQFLQVPDGTPIKTVGVTASATGPVGASEESIAQMAAAEVAKKALVEMGVPPPPAPVVDKGRKKAKKQPAEGRSVSRKSGWLAVGALLAILQATVK